MMPQRCTHTELAEIVLDESGYTQMWQEEQISPMRSGTAWKT